MRARRKKIIANLLMTHHFSEILEIILTICDFLKLIL